MYGDQHGRKSARISIHRGGGGGGGMVHSLNNTPPPPPPQMNRNNSRIYASGDQTEKCLQNVGYVVRDIATESPWRRRNKHTLVFACFGLLHQFLVKL